MLDSQQKSEPLLVLSRIKYELDIMFVLKYGYFHLWFICISNLWSFHLETMKKWSEYSSFQYEIGLTSLNNEIWMNSRQEPLFEERSLDL